MSEDNLWEDLVISILSVNQYPLEKTYTAIESLREAGLFDPQNLARWGAVQITVKLANAGCDRGVFMTNLFATRLAALGDHVSKVGVSQCEKVILSKDKDAITRLLMPVNGVGPRVLQNLFLLRDIK